jgi:hypothetical protein
VIARNGDDHPALVSAHDGSLVWLVNTPWGAIWGDPMDTILLDQLLENALGLRAFVDAPASVTIDASDAGSGLEWLDYSIDGGATWTDVDVATLPTTFDIAEPGDVHLIVRAADRAGNPAVSSVRFEVESGEVDPDPDPPGEPLTREDCRDLGWYEHGFPNHGQCVRFVETGKGAPPGHQP